MPVTPIFELSQSPTHLHIDIKVLPSVPLRDASVGLEGGMLVFNAKPYLLRLRLPGKVVDDGAAINAEIMGDTPGSQEPVGKSSQADTGFVRVRIVLQKATAGEVFDGLHLPAKFLSGSGDRITTAGTPALSGPAFDRSGDVLARLAGLRSADEALEQEWNEQRARVAARTPSIEVVDSKSFEESSYSAPKAAVEDSGASQPTAPSRSDPGKQAKGGGKQVSRSSALLALEAPLAQYYRTSPSGPSSGAGASDDAAAAAAAGSSSPSRTATAAGPLASLAALSTQEATVLVSTHPYGFNDGHEGVLERLAPHERVAAALLDPMQEANRVPPQARWGLLERDSMARITAARLVEDAAIADEDMVFQSAVAASCHWDKAFATRKAWAKRAAREAKAAAAAAAASSPAGGDVKDSPEGASASTKAGSASSPSDRGAPRPGAHAIDADGWFEGFTQEEKGRLLALPNRKEFVLPTGSRAEVRALADIAALLYAYCHEHRCTLGAEGEGATELSAGEDEVSAESARTVVEMCPQLSFLVHFDSMAGAQRECLRRALGVPYMRCWRLARLVVRDVGRVLACGRPAVVRCLLGLREMLRRDPVRSRHCGLWVDDAIVWTQRTSPAVWQRAAADYRAAAAKASPDSLGLPVSMDKVEEAAALLRAGGAEDPAAAWVAVGGVVAEEPRGEGASEGSSSAKVVVVGEDDAAAKQAAPQG